MNRDNVVFVLVRPNFLGNIGASARVLKNFGFKRLVLVRPPRNYLDAEARKMAVGAFDVLKSARVVDSLQEALSDVNLAIGTSSCQKRNEKPRSLVESVAQLDGIDMGVGDKLFNLAFVFGDERDGLSNEELAFCHDVLQIESEDDFPSLNLSQALGIVAYQTSLKLRALNNTSGHEPSWDLPTGEESGEFFNLLIEIMELASFSRRYNRDKIGGEVRRALMRMRPSTREIKLLKGFLLTLRAKLSQGRDL